MSQLHDEEQQKQEPSPDLTCEVFDRLSERVIGCAVIVSKTLGAGLPRIIYENALAHELRKTGLAVNQQQAVPVYYDGMIVGDYTADLLVENTAMIRLAAVRTRNKVDVDECTNYLKASRHPLCMVFNFGNSELEMTRVTIGV